MKRCFSAAVDKNYEELIPPYILAIREWSDDDIVVFHREELSPKTEETIKKINDAKTTIVTNHGSGYHDVCSVTAALRFIEGERELSGYDYVMITDIDMLLLVDHWDWYTSRITHKLPFCGHHGAWNRPLRPNICSSWNKDFERVSGGLFCVSGEWWNKTRFQRKLQGEEMKRADAVHYREEDEVCLCRIIKGSGMRVPAVGSFPHDYRGVHIGDFKFDHRWKSMKTMNGFLTDNVCRKYMVLRSRDMWKNVLSEIRNPALKTMMKNIDTHIAERF